MDSDFTSALYLGLRHEAQQLGDWPALTSGKPAALALPPLANALAATLARLMGQQAACLLPSSLHLFWDLFGMLARAPVALLVDSAAYPVARWGANCRQLPCLQFRHGDAAAAADLAARAAGAGQRPILLADGYTPGDAAAPPLAAYAAIAARHGGWLVLDDTQALGVLGEAGSGSGRLPGLAGKVLIGASLAKGFGAPLAVLAGSSAVLQRFAACSVTRVHCSPPNMAALLAGQRALEVNRLAGAGLRAALRERVLALRQVLAEAGLACQGGMFPVQHVPLASAAQAVRVAAGLRRRGVRVLVQGRGVTLLLRADHTAAEVAHAGAAIVQLWENEHDASIRSTGI